jgi:hypothetical protein
MRSASNNGGLVEVAKCVWSCRREIMDPQNGGHPEGICIACLNWKNPCDASNQDT